MNLVSRCRTVALSPNAGLQRFCLSHCRCLVLATKLLVTEKKSGFFVKKKKKNTEEDLLVSSRGGKLAMLWCTSVKQKTFQNRLHCDVKKLGTFSMRCQEVDMLQHSAWHAQCRKRWSWLRCRYLTKSKKKIILSLNVYFFYICVIRMSGDRKMGGWMTEMEVELEIC